MVCIFDLQLSAKLRHDAAHRLEPRGKRVTRTGLVCVRACDHLLPLSRGAFGNGRKGLPKNYDLNCWEVKGERTPIGAWSC